MLLKLHSEEKMDTKKYEVRRNLSMYSEKKFAEELSKSGYTLYYPFKDIGIDILATKDKKIFKYQLKARDLNTKSAYWFLIRISDLNEYLTERNMYYVFCALLANNQFDFFIVPIKKVFDWWNEHTNGLGVTHNKEFLKIKPIGRHKYEIRPKRLKKKIDVNKYLLK